MLFTIEIIERRKKSDQIRIELAEDFRAITQTSPDCVLSVDQLGIILSANPATERMFGYKTSTLPGRSLDLLLPRSALGQMCSYELEALRSDGTRFFVEATEGSFGDRTSVFLRDVTERKHIEESLRLTQGRLARASEIAAVAELSASIAHEISQPVSAMVANGQAALRWLAAAPAEPDDATAAVQRIVRDGKDAKAIIERLRSLHKRNAPSLTPVHLPVICKEMMDLVRPKADAAGIELLSEIPSELPLIPADKIQLQQVLHNLINNGIESMQATEIDPRCLIVRAAVRETFVYVEVEDSGVGFENVDSVFDPFITTKTEGLGMGLSICRSIVESHGGAIGAGRSAKHGSIFWFTIPLQQGEERAI
jgi:PAS domain S-box-containing protein